LTNPQEPTEHKQTKTTNSIRAACVVRQSQGDDDSISLALQRESVQALATEIADEVDMIDLGTHTGFSIHTHDADEERIDTHPEIRKLIRDLRAGRYDYLCAWDDTRLARDQFYWQIDYAARLGECEFRFVEPPPDDDLVFRVTRAVESDVKRREIEKVRQAIQEREERGYYQGRPPFGMQFDDDGQHLIPDPDSWDIVCDVLRLRDQGHSYAKIAEQTPVNKSRVGRIVRNRKRYESHGGDFLS